MRCLAECHLDSKPWIYLTIFNIKKTISVSSSMFNSFLFLQGSSSGKRPEKKISHSGNCLILRVFYRMGKKKIEMVILRGQCYNILAGINTYLKNLVLRRK